MLSRQDVKVVKKVAKENDIPWELLAAMIEIESNGRTSALVNGRREPLIRFEGHYFDRRLQGSDKALARKRGLANPKGGRVKNPRSQQARWDKLLIPASDINEQAALESCSWGVGQVMGAHWKRLGYRSVQDMVRRCRTDFEGQVDIMVKYFHAFGLIDEFQRYDYKGIARGYNGAHYWKNKYDQKLKYAATRYRSGGTAVINQSESHYGMLRMGHRGADVRELQKLLVRANIPVKVDGDFGQNTKDAVMEFQRQHGLKADGLVGPKTEDALEKYRQKNEDLTNVTVVETVTDTDEGKSGATAVGVGVGLGGITAAVQEAADKLSSVVDSSEWFATVYVALTMTAACLVIAGSLYTLYGWIKANRKSDRD